MQASVLPTAGQAHQYSKSGSSELAVLAGRSTRWDGAVVTRRPPVRA